MQLGRAREAQERRELREKEKEAEAMRLARRGPNKVRGERGRGREEEDVGASKGLGSAF